MKTKNLHHLLFCVSLIFLLTNIQGQEKSDIIIRSKSLDQQVTRIFIKEELSIKYKTPKSLSGKDIFLFVDKQLSTKVKPDENDSLNVKLMLDTLDLNKDNKTLVTVEIGFKTNVDKGDSILEKKKMEVVYIPAILFSSSSNFIDKANIKSQIKVQFLIQPPNTESLKIYANNLPIGKLERDDNEKNVYSFILENTLNKEDSLSKILTPGNDKCEAKISLYYGTSFENRTLITDNFTVLFGNDRIVRKITASIVMGGILILIIIILWARNWQILRDQSTLIKKRPFSLAKTQFAFWTILILIAYFIIWYHTGSMIEITGQLLGLMGISAGTTLGGSLIDNNDISKGNERHQNEESKDFFDDILSDQSGLSIHRLQNVVFTVAIGCYFLYEVFHNYRIPALDNNLVILMGMSSAAYLAVKNGENKVAPNNTAQPENVKDESKNDTSIKG